MKTKINEFFKKTKEKFKNIKEKSIEIINSIKKKITDKENVGIVILGVLILIFLVFAAIYVIGTRNISAIEEKSLRNKSSDLMMYIEDITLSDSKEIDKYIIYSLNYSYNYNSKDTLTCEEIYNFLKDNFTLETSVEAIRNMGVSPLMLERNITYETTTDSYKLNITKKDANTISQTKITFYKLEKISKLNKRKYSVTYSKYEIIDPYKMLNYYMDENMNNSGTEDENGNVIYDLVDTTPIVNYLTGSGKLSDIKSLIREDNIDKYATLDKKGKIKVTYVVKDEQLLIDNIK